MAEEHSVVCAFTTCRSKRAITRAQHDCGGYWLCHNHRLARDVDVSGGWGFVNDVEVDDGQGIRRTA